MPADVHSRAAECLRGALHVTNVDRRVFGLGQSTRDEIVTTNRFILILRGEMRYTIEGKTAALRAGTQFLVPAWVRRVWSVPRGGPCEIAWCEFDEAGGQGLGGELLRRRLKAGELRRETSDYLQMLRASRGVRSIWTGLHLEARLKLMLVRFFEKADALPGTEAQPVHPKVKSVLRWIPEHFREPHALEALYAECGMTRNYFRELFSAATQCSPHEYIERLRLRHARYLLRSTSWQLKRIAAEVGYDDPLYFSRLYRKFWKRAPSEERE